MKVQGSAFYFGHEIAADDARFPDFFSSLVNQGQDSEWPLHRPFIEGFSHRRRLFMNELPDAWCGVILSARATDFHHYVQQIGNVVNVVARDNGPNAPVEVNFFCIRRDSNKGIYSNYYGSYAFGSFLQDLWASYRFIVESARDAHIALIAEDNDIDGINEIRDAYSTRGKGAYSPLYNPGSFEQLLNQLATVAEVRLTTYSVDTPNDRPVSDRINNVHKVYRLAPEGQRFDQALRSWILQKKNGATRHLQTGKSTFSGSVVGTDTDGECLTVPFTSSLDDHLDFDYDDIGSFNVANIAENPCLTAMLAKLRNAVLFRS